ncbi:NAD(P)/FAD-dependent oxidoreductase [Cytophagaceae bacterium YF14B1]|uniref:NAD(P)/FAD-dependent oxidoreductase n=1 Tax=Xanthocytophaga flava TaxID=3048013 RepID=A0AAE3QN09_9BACT|nr:NAD(P)/FAD-dependent oxidoreductase [Xanthocytophaga flavus]MDJ1479921.1 NAD(P)/FAD-dependent oxidoreductase [Xanthocytophaga flavus]
MFTYYITMVVIIGAGIAGLTCAKYLQDKGIQSTILEASDAVGGRVRTDKAGGFLLDRGFQIFLPSYPEAQKLLQYKSLQFQEFQSGAIIRKQGRFHKMPNPLQHLLSAPEALIAPVGSLRDKVKILQLSQKLKSVANASFFQEKTNDSTVNFLHKYGYSDEIIDTFFRPFFSGVFLEKELHTSYLFFQFLFKQFATGQAVIPAQGMQAIPQQIASYLPSNSIRLQTKVRYIDGQTVHLENGESLEADTIVIATDARQFHRWYPDTQSVEFNGTTCLYFTAPKSPLSRPMLAINADADGLVNHIAVLSDVAPSYTPTDEALISVNLVGQSPYSNGELAQKVHLEMTEWFGAEAKNWQHIRTYSIPHALPQYLPETKQPIPLKLTNYTYACGDYTRYPSLNGAMQSGREVAEMIVQMRQ